MSTRIPTLRRLIATACLCLILGSLTSVLIAWAFEFVHVALSPYTQLLNEIEGARNVRAYRVTRIGGEDREIRAFTDESNHHETGYLDDSQGEPPKPVRVTFWRGQSAMPKGADYYEWIERGVGFPFICFFKWQEESMPIQGAIELPDPFGLSEHWPGQPTRGLPYLPIWPNLIANTVFWGGVWWCVLFVPAVIRRRRRVKRGQCAACGYDLSANAAGTSCPECGSPVLIHPR